MRGSQNAKGPASAPTLPDHGSNNPEQESAVNTAKHNTEQDAASSEKLFEDAFAQFEAPIAALVGRVRALDFLVCWALERPQDERGSRLIAEGMIDAIFYLTDQVRKETGALDDLWTTLDKNLPVPGAAR